MNIVPIQDVWSDDAATLAMGEAFDPACKSLRNLGSAVPEIIAYLIIKAAKTGERDPGPATPRAAPVAVVVLRWHLKCPLLCTLEVTLSVFASR